MPRCLISKKLPRPLSRAHGHHPCLEEGERFSLGKALRSAIGAREHKGRAIPGSAGGRTHPAPGGRSAWRRIPAAGELNRSLAACSAHPSLHGKLTGAPSGSHWRTCRDLGAGWICRSRSTHGTRQPANLGAIPHLRIAGSTNSRRGVWPACAVGVRAGSGSAVSLAPAGSAPDCRAGSLPRFRRTGAGRSAR